MIDKDRPSCPKGHSKTQRANGRWVCRPCANESSRRWRKKRHGEDPDYYRNKYRSAVKPWKQRTRDDSLEHYGGVCACCGETERMFLQIDHVENDGAAHRREIGSGGYIIHMWLKRNGYPEGFQILCANCNFGKLINSGVCPHKQEDKN